VATQTGEKLPAVSFAVKKGVITFAEKVGLVFFSSAVGVYLVQHGHVDEVSAIEAAAASGGIAALTYLLGKANQWIANHPG